MHLTTERLLVRNLEVADLAHFHVYRSNPEVTKYQGFDVLTMEQAYEFILAKKDKQFGQAGEWVQYGIENRTTQKSVGFRQEGYFIENIFFKGKWGSEYQYALLKREWDQKNN